MHTKRKSVRLRRCSGRVWIIPLAKSSGERREFSRTGQLLIDIYGMIHGNLSYIFALNLVLALILSIVVSTFINSEIYSVELLSQWTSMC